jgi:hypothetical protein
LFLIFVVLYQHARDGSAQSGLPGLKRNANLSPGFLFFSLPGQIEHAVHGIPELRERSAEKLLLLGRLLNHGEPLLQAQGIIEVGANPFKLRCPGGQGIRLVAVQHVAHGQRQRVQVVLDPQQLQRILAVPAREVVLQGAEPGNLPCDVGGIRHHCDQRDDQSQNQPGNGGSAWCLNLHRLEDIPSAERLPSGAPALACAPAARKSNQDFWNDLRPCSC